MSGAGDIFIAAAEAAIEAGADRAVRVELGAEVLRAVADRRPALAQACAALDADPGPVGPLRTVRSTLAALTAGRGASRARREIPTPAGSAASERQGREIAAVARHPPD